MVESFWLNGARWQIKSRRKLRKSEHSALFSSEEIIAIRERKDGKLGKTKKHFIRWSNTGERFYISEKYG